MLPGQQVSGEVFVQELALHQELDHPTSEDFNHGLQSGQGDVEKGALLIKATLENDCVEMRVPPQHVPERLMRDDHAGKQLPAGGFAVELPKDVVDQTRHLSEQATIVTEERSECLRHREDKLAVR
jgi:hypothetical protein